MNAPLCVDVLSRAVVDNTIRFNNGEVFNFVFCKFVSPGAVLVRYNLSNVCFMSLKSADCSCNSRSPCWKNFFTEFMLHCRGERAWWPEYMYPVAGRRESIWCVSATCKFRLTWLSLIPCVSLFLSAWISCFVSWVIFQSFKSLLLLSFRSLFNFVIGMVLTLVPRFFFCWVCRCSLFWWP